MEKINIFEHLKKGWRAYARYLAWVAGKAEHTFTSGLSRIRNGTDVEFKLRQQIVDAINKVERTDFIVNDFDWTWTPGEWRGNK